ncbi:helix-turn-helix domain-containing protein [Streptomyces cinerochromogenes]|uniref:AraC-like ligand-binding domain-containing protein n=1 Tax=Streptomyces cinerochromogenes TaxID=66422 RepID=UPI0033BBF1C7
MWSHMSTDAIPPRERLDWYADSVSREVLPAQLSCERPAEFRGEAAVLDLGGVRVTRAAMSPLRSRRTAAMIRRGDPEQYQLALLLKGTTSLSQHRNECTIGAGDLMLWNTSRPSDYLMPAAGGQVRVRILARPRKIMPLSSRRLDRMLAHRIPGDRGMAAILASFMSSLDDHGSECTPQELRRLETVAVDLVTACLAQHLDAEDRLCAELRSRALVHRIHAFIEQNLGDPTLSPPAIAAHHNISVRTLHHLFHGQGETVSARIRRRRLEQCRADLADPVLRGRPVGAIAARWGFSGPVLFSRAFREAYGLSPTEFRALNIKDPRAERSAE